MLQQLIRLFSVNKEYRTIIVPCEPTLTDQVPKLCAQMQNFSRYLFYSNGDVGSDKAQLHSLIKAAIVGMVDKST